MDQRADIKSPKECVLSSDKLSAYSYRVKSDQCKPLSNTISNQIKSEEEKCVKYTTQNTEVSTIWRSSKTDVYTERKHSYIYKEDKICISQDPIVYCSSGSVAKDIRRKSVKYVCLPEGRVAKLYESRTQPPSSTAPPAPLPRTSAGSPSSTSASPRAALPSSTSPGSSAGSLPRS